MIKKLIESICCLLFLVSCSGSSKKEAVIVSPETYFGSSEGCFLLYNMKSQKFELIVGEANCRIQYAACSTFKVPLAVMAFESGILKDEHTVFEWDGKKHERPEANQNHNAKSWMQESIVWYSQRITTKMGAKDLKNYLDRFDYGNRDISAGITEAWLVSPSSPGPALKISAYEQIEFLRKLWTNQLPAMRRSMQITRELTYLETSPNGYKLHGKTGSKFIDSDGKMQLGWFVSHVQNAENEYLAVTNIKDTEPLDSSPPRGLKSKEITKKILRDLSLW